MLSVLLRLSSVFRMVLHDLYLRKVLEIRPLLCVRSFSIAFLISSNFVSINECNSGARFYAMV